MKTKIQSCIVGFMGKPTCVLSLYDDVADLLVVSKIVAYRRDRFEDCLIICNSDLPAREVVFDEDKFHDSVSRYFEMENSGRLDISRNAQRAAPGSSIEKDGVRESGNRMYRFSPDITNEQVAVLATCWYVKQAQSVSKVLDMQSRLLAIQQGSMITI